MPYQDWMTPTDQESELIPWIMKKLAAGGDPDFYKAPLAPVTATAIPAAAPAAARVPPASGGPAPGASAPPLAAATNRSFDDPDTAQALAQAQIDPTKILRGPDQYEGTYIANATKGQPGILDRIVNNPQAGALLAQMGAGLLRGKNMQQGLANAAEASGDFLTKSQAVKRTPIANGTAILEEYADGTSKVVPVAATARPKPEKGYQWTADGRLEPIPGGPKDQKAIELSRTLDNNFVRLSTKSDNVVKAIDKAMGQVNAFSAGPVGQATSWIGGTPGADLEGTLDEIQANIGFAELEDMRKSSPTGGALGQVAVRELEFLQAVKGSLKQKQTPAQLKANLERIKQEFMSSRQRLQEAYEADIAAGLIQRGSRPSLEDGGSSAAPAAPRGGSVQDRASGYLR